MSEEIAQQSKEQCKHLWQYTGSDDYIEEMLPGFHRTHRQAALGQEWQFCRDCGQAKLVHLPSSSETLTPGTAPRISRYAQELMEREGQGDG